MKARPALAVGIPLANALAATSCTSAKKSVAYAGGQDDRFNIFVDGEHFHDFWIFLVPSARSGA